MYAAVACVCGYRSKIFGYIFLLSLALSLLSSLMNEIYPTIFDFTKGFTLTLAHKVENYFQRCLFFPFSSFIEIIELNNTSVDTMNSVFQSMQTPNRIESQLKYFVSSAIQHLSLSPCVCTLYFLCLCLKFSKQLLHCSIGMLVKKGTSETGN